MPQRLTREITLADGTTSFRMSSGALFGALIHRMNIDEQLRKSFTFRVRSTVNGFFGTDTQPNRRRPNRLYSLREALDVALALQLQRGFVGERMSVDIVKANADLLHALWARSLIKTDNFMIQVPLDAFWPKGVRNTGASAVFETADLKILHKLSPLDDRPLVSIGASAIADSLIASLEAIGLRRWQIEEGIQEIASSSQMGVQAPENSAAPCDAAVGGPMNVDTARNTE